MNRMKKLTLAALTALALTTGAITATSGAQLAGDPSQWLAKKGSFDITVATRKVNEYEGQHLARKVNEYEGQHFALAGDPSQWG